MKITSILYLGSLAHGLVLQPRISLTNDIQPWETDLDQSVDGHNVTHLLLSRDDGQCTDPTFGTSQWADYSNDGNGRYAGTCGVTGHDSHKCWTDVYTVQAQIQWSPWKVVSAGVDCAGSASCSISDTWEFQSCTSQSTSVSVTTGIQSEVLNIGGEMTHETGTTECQTHSSQKTCGILPVHPRSDGFFTVGWSDWSYDFPTGKHHYSGKYHCSTDVGTKGKDLPGAGPFGNFIFNKRTFNASDVPGTHKDLVDPVWANKLALTIPNDEDAITYLFSVTIEQYGWDWFDALQKQNVQWIRGTGEPADFLAAENTTRVLSSTNSLNGDSALASNTPNETRLLWPQTAAIFATTPRPESSKLSMSWSISDEYEQQFDDGGYYLARKDLHNELGSVWDDSLTPLTQFATFMENRDVVEWWRLQFETSLGTVQGVSPVLSEFGRRSSL
ncbi:periplasmic binding protein-like II, partial [Aureobasidium melanogenum]